MPPLSEAASGSDPLAPLTTLLGAVVWEVWVGWFSGAVGGAMRSLPPAAVATDVAGVPFPDVQGRDWFPPRFPSDLLTAFASEVEEILI